MITISPGHYGVGTGAVGYVDEFTEALRVTEKVHSFLQTAGIPCHVIVDRTSSSQRENIAYLVKAHNNTKRELDVSVHLNATAGKTERPIGVEVLYVNPNFAEAARKLSLAMATSARLPDRGAKRRTDLAILNGTHKPCLLLEVCFVNSRADVTQYEKHFEEICWAIAHTLAEIIGKPFSKATQTTVFNAGELFTFQALAERLQPFYVDPIFVESMLREGIQEKVFQPVWLELWKRGNLTFVDFCGLCALKLCNKK